MGTHGLGVPGSEPSLEPLRRPHRRRQSLQALGRWPDRPEENVKTPKPRDVCILKFGIASNTQPVLLVSPDFHHKHEHFIHFGSFWGGEPQFNHQNAMLDPQKEMETHEALRCRWVLKAGAPWPQFGGLSLESAHLPESHTNAMAVQMSYGSYGIPPGLQLHIILEIPCNNSSTHKTKKNLVHTSQTANSDHKFGTFLAASTPCSAACSQFSPDCSRKLLHWSAGASRSKLMSKKHKVLRDFGEFMDIHPQNFSTHSKLNKLTHFGHGHASQSGCLNDILVFRPQGLC